MDQLRFTIWEMLSLIGVVQCVYILVYILFRVANIRQIILPLLYFLILGTAFFLDFAKGYIGEFITNYDVIVWAAWGLGIPFSVLLIMQVAQIARLPSAPFWGVLLFIPIALFFSIAVTGFHINKSCDFQNICSEFNQWLHISGVVAGALSVLVIWGQRRVLDDLHTQKASKERYWLIISLIIVNIGFLSLTALETTALNIGNTIGLARTVLGLAFIYLVTTSLFRIYPQALILSNIKKKDDILSAEEEKLAQKIQDLLTLDKVYHEPTYSRADLAKELNASEAYVSRVINIHFKKSLPQLLNEQRIMDAKRLLLDTNVNIKIVAQEVGFNSIPSFNRVFKELEGRSPSDYRNNMIK